MSGRAYNAEYSNGPYTVPMKERIERWVERIPESGCWVWMGYVQRSGHGCIGGGRSGGSKRAHRVAYETYVGPIPPGLQVCHRCDVACCVNPAHLFLGTQLDNMGDAARKLRCRKKLTADQAREIWAQLRSGKPMRRIARDFGINLSTVQCIRNGRSWRHVA